jgi:GNAT superfamily N-acetyltransferase
MSDVLVEFVYNNIKEDLDDTLEEWTVKVVGWEFKPIYRMDNLVAVVMIKENEVHVATDKRYHGKWLSRKVIKDIFGKILEEYGQVKTCVGFGNTKAENFVTRLGFEPDLIVYTLDTIKHK